MGSGFVGRRRRVLQQELGLRLDGQQQALPLGLGAVPNRLGLFWCCGDCLGVTQGRVSLRWQPPDQRVGVCHFCGQVYEFGSRYGQDELVQSVEGGR